MLLSFSFKTDIFIVRLLSYLNNLLGFGVKNSLQQRKIKQLPKKILLTIGAIGLVKLLGISGDIVLAQSRSQCEEYARDYAKRNSESQGTTLRGAARGAAGGALIGGIFGDAGKGAGIGALTGTLRGSSQKSSDYQRLYNIALDDCMSGRVSPR